MESIFQNQRTLIWMVLVLVAIPYVIYLVPQYLGVNAYIVDSNSMAPEMPAGSVVYENSVSPQTLESGDVIIFNPNRSNIDEEVVIHRIIDVREDNYTRYFRTQGDANVEPDPGWTPAYRVTGEKLFSIPYLGYFIMATSSLPFIVLLVILPATLLIYGEMKNIMENWEEMEEENRQPSNPRFPMKREKD